MSSPRIGDEEWKALYEVAKFLNQFITKSDRPRYGYIDRLANPYNHRVVEVTLQEALREARSAEYWIPSTEAIKRFIELCSEDLRYATITSALALAYHGKEGS